MTRLVTCGYETGDVNELGVNGGQAGGVSVVNATPTPRAGGNWCVKCTTASSNQYSYKTFGIPARSELWLRFGFYLHWVTYSGTALVLMQATDAAASAQIDLEYQNADGLLRVRRGNQGTILITTPIAFTQDTWHVIEWHIQILSTTTGQTDLYVDGTFMGTFSGQVANTSTLNVAGFQFGVTNYGNTSGAGTYTAFDDIAINDVSGTINNQRIGDGRVVLLLPTGAGSVTTLTRGGADSGANWSQLNEIPPSVAQYVGSANPGDRDLYAMSDLPANVTVNSVEAIALAQNTDAGAGSLGMTIKSGATTNEATAAALGTSAAYVGARWETDPNTGAAWTLAAVNAVEAGLTVR